MARVSNFIQLIVLEQILHFACQIQLQLVNIEFRHTTFQAVFARLAYQRLNFSPLLYQAKISLENDYDHLKQKSESQYIHNRRIKTWKLMQSNTAKLEIN